MEVLIFFGLVVVIVGLVIAVFYFDFSPTTFISDLIYSIQKIICPKRVSSQENFYKELYNSEIANIESQMKNHSIDLPEFEEGKEKDLNEYLKSIERHFRFYGKHCIKGYEFLIINPCNGMRVFFNKKKIFIITNRCLDFIDAELRYKYDEKRKKIVYYYPVTKNKIAQTEETTIEELFGRFETEANIEYVKANSSEISMSHLRWHVGGLDPASKHLSNIASGAVMGGLLFGGVGALAGAMYSDKDAKKHKNEKIFIRFGANYSNDWIVSEAYEFSQTFKRLNEHFPDKREDDQYIDF